ncbi:mucin-13-like [Takifugu flavidus]|uniref:mucin-13-like n=1 Tax=Takifugu flavidus TaxID=433684 RepID=UPI0025444497|nr:mucin-13-like [Takifugu flavidus]
MVQCVLEVPLDVLKDLTFTFSLAASSCGLYNRRNYCPVINWNSHQHISCNYHQCISCNSHQCISCNYHQPITCNYHQCISCNSHQCISCNSHQCISCNYHQCISCNSHQCISCNSHQCISCNSHQCISCNSHQCISCNSTSASAVTPASTSPGNTTSPTTGPVVTTPQQTTPPPNACSSQPCGRGATCENRGEDFVCLCLPGDFYNNNTNSCEAAKVFPGELEIQNLLFNELLTDKTSERFKTTSANVSRDIEGVFGRNEGYLTSIVLEFRQRTRSSRQAGAAIASVQIIFGQTATINKDGVVNQLKNCNNCTTVRNGTFTAAGLCSSNTCDVTTTTCEDGDDGNYTCSCLDGFFTTTFTNDRMCIACPSGQQFVNNECVDCPLGYSGFNCGENWELVLLIVGPVLGGLLLITLILLITVAVRSKKHRKASSTADIGTPFISHQSTKAPLINGSKGVPAVAGVPSIPRATAHNSPYSSTNLEMIPSNSQQNLITNGRNSRHHEDYGQSRPQNNPYSQIRPVSSSYTPNQGIVNPYYKNDSR